MRGSTSLSLSSTGGVFCLASYCWKTSSTSAGFLLQQWLLWQHTVHSNSISRNIVARCRAKLTTASEASKGKVIREATLGRSSVEFSTGVVSLVTVALE